MPQGESASDKPAFFDEWPEGPQVGQPEQDVREVAVPGAAGSNEAISVRAYEIYLALGAKDGLDQEDWLKAEAQLRARN